MGHLFDYRYGKIGDRALGKNNIGDKNLEKCPKCGLMGIFRWPNKFAHTMTEKFDVVLFCHTNQFEMNEHRMVERLKMKCAIDDSLWIGIPLIERYKLLNCWTV